MPTDPTINIIKRSWNKTKNSHLRTSLSVEHIISLLEFCLKTIYFQFQGRFCKQLQGAAMWSPISTVPSCTWRNLRPGPSVKLSILQWVWKRYVDHTFVVTKTSHKEEFLEHLNSLDPHIQFSSETSREDGSIPFLDTLVMPQSEKSLITTVYRKPMHTDLYLQWDSHHNLAAKYSVINTLTYRAKTVCSSPQLLKEEEDNLRQVLIMHVPWLGFE